MTTIQNFPLGGNYVSGVAPNTMLGSYTGISGSAVIGTYASTSAERDQPPGCYTDTARRR
ncbi:hypothetical protein [Arthrobacter sp. 4R501]|uniref:hypothetical protein n=1 Tax=Arthrobacter sp. 4R501 TaxID=2058886 RepID=UPI000CE3EE47|nr:hypothetical protein [Arthrobacter sp. 4R501]